MQARITQLDARIAQLDIDIAKADAAVASAAAVPGAVVEGPPEFLRNGPPEEVFIIVPTLAFLAFMPVIIAITRGLWKRGTSIGRVQKQQLPSDLSERLARLEAMGETTALEVERIGEGQRFVTRLLTERGERVHTGDSDDLTRGFAESFTKNFDKLANKYPIYAELRNVFDLALVSTLIASHDLPGQVGWHMTHFGPQGEYEPLLAAAPSEVESVMNHRILGGKHVVAVVSGGVRVDARPLVERSAVKTDTYGLMAGERRSSVPQNLIRRAWWWD
jgi:hypothetical protein